jgi:hypothetical protein
VFVLITTNLTTSYRREEIKNKGKQRKAKESKGKQSKGKQRKTKESKGKQRKAKERNNQLLLCIFIELN